MFLERNEKYLFCNLHSSFSASRSLTRVKKGEPYLREDTYLVTVIHKKIRQFENWF